jgi:hypothetical protein
MLERQCFDLRHGDHQKTAQWGSTQLVVLILLDDRIKRMRWAGREACMGKMWNAYKRLMQKPERKRLVGRPRRRWETVWRRFRKTCGVWEQAAVVGTGGRLAVLNMTVNLVVPYKAQLASDPCDSKRIEHNTQDWVSSLITKYFQYVSA